MIITENAEFLRSIVKRKPGIRFMELQRESGLSHDTIEYYVKRSENTKIFRTIREGNITRLFPIEFDKFERDLTTFIRQKSSRHLLVSILSTTSIMFKDLLDTVNLSPSTISWHLTRMKDKGVIGVQRRNDNHHHYYMINKSQTIEFFSKHRNNFEDDVAILN